MAEAAEFCCMLGLEDAPLPTYTYNIVDLPILHTTDKADIKQPFLLPQMAEDLRSGLSVDNPPLPHTIN